MAGARVKSGSKKNNGLGPSLLPYIPLGIKGGERVRGILRPFIEYYTDSNCMEVGGQMNLSRLLMNSIVHKHQFASLVLEN